MNKFHTLPAEEAVTWVRAWTEHPWPITFQEALSIRDSLGWKPFPNEPDFFTTPLSHNGHWNGYIVPGDDFQIRSVTFALSSPSSIWPEIDKNEVQLAEESLFLYAHSLTQLWGPAEVKERKEETTYIRWKLPSKVSISLILADALINVDIYSPWFTRLNEEYAQTLEEMEDYD